METWKDIPGFEGFYMASSLGYIKSVARIETRKDGSDYPIRERILKPAIGTTGYLFLNLCKNGKRKIYKVHRLVAITFHGSSNLQVNHINGKKTDNRSCNLEWVTHSENGKHAHATGLNKGCRGENHPSSKLTMAQANEIRSKYKPFDYTISMLSKEYGIDGSIISGIIKNKRYAI